MLKKYRICYILKENLCRTSIFTSSDCSNGLSSQSCRSIFTNRLSLIGATRLYQFDIKNSPILNRLLKKSKYI